MPDGLPTPPDYPCLVRLAPLVNEVAVSPAVTLRSAAFAEGTTTTRSGIPNFSEKPSSLRSGYVAPGGKALQELATPPTFSNAQSGKVIQMPVSPPLTRQAATSKRPTLISDVAALPKFQ